MPIPSLGCSLVACPGRNRGGGTIHVCAVALFISLALRRLVPPRIVLFVLDVPGFVVTPVDIGRLPSMQTRHTSRQALFQLALALLLHPKLDGLLQRIAVGPILVQLGDEVFSLVCPVDVGLLRILRVLRELASVRDTVCTPDAQRVAVQQLLQAFSSSCTC